MSKTETKARTGEDLSDPVGALRSSLTGFVGQIKDIQSEINLKLQQQEERLNMLDRKSVSMGRPALSAANEPEAPHKKAFEAYVRSGDDDALRGLSLEGKALNTAVSGDGGYLVDPVTSDRVHSVLKATSSLRQIAGVVNVEASAYDVLVDQTDIGSGWTSETGSVSETGTPTIDRITIPLHELSALPKASQRILEDSAFDIEGWLAARIADKFARAEAAAFINGDGIDKPKGILTHTQVANDSWSWGSLGYEVTGIDGAFSSPDNLLDLVYALDARYRSNAAFVMNSKTAGAVRKIKDADGRFLWADSLAAGEPARLLGYPVVIAEDMPDMSGNGTAIAFGDFESGYTIAERPDLRVLRDPFSAKPNVLFYATKRVGGDVSDFAAIKLLKFATS
jgi:HK97 family phage major capsid protein